MILFDGHVHIYDCFDLDLFLTAAWKNLSSYAEKLGGAGDGDAQYYLLLTESAGLDYFKKLTENVSSSSQMSSWTVEVVEDDLSLALHHKTHPKRLLTVVAGRQLITKENLEVLALFSHSVFPDGMELEEAVQRVAAEGGIGVCPWGAGKWLGARGKVLSEFAKSGTKGTFFLGDSGGRPFFWPRSSLCSNDSFAERLISGTDPLPISGEEHRVGSFGGMIKAGCDPERPAAALRELLLDKTKISGFGTPMGVISFLRNQIGVRM